jgi:hypothetical protein
LSNIVALLGGQKEKGQREHDHPLPFHIPK